MAAFVTSATPDITEGTLAAFSQRTQSVIIASRKYRTDIEVNGLGFNIDPDGPRDGVNGPYVRQSMPVQKQQQDNSKEPGEQTLDGYWIRSQSSWHRGAGINFYEPGSEEETQYRFAESSGLDVWSVGRVSALHKMTNVQAATGPCFVADAGTDGTTRYVVYLSDTAVLGWAGSSYALNTPAAEHNGRYYFFGYKNYYKVGWVSPASATVGVWAGDRNAVIAKNATVEPKLWYVKDRLIVSHGANLFEVPPLAAVPVDLSDPTVAAHKPQDQQTVWLDVVDGPSAIYAAHRGGIVRFALEDAASGSTPKLSQAYRVLELPAGETLKSMFGYLGRFLILSTSIGIRVCAISGNGDLTMGQVIVEASQGDFGAMCAAGDLVYVAGASVPRHGTSGGANILGWGTATGLLGINLGQMVNGDTLRFGWAMDERSDITATATSALVVGATKYLAISGSGIWKSHADYVPGGYLALGKIRFGTLAKKLYRSFDLNGAVEGGSLRIDILDERGSSYFNVTMDGTTGIFENVSLPLDATRTHVQPVSSFTWTSGIPAMLDLLQLRALPAPERVRQIRYPLKCHGVEQDRNGQTFGRAASAAERLFALEEMERYGVPVNVVDHRTGESFTATIDEIDFQGTTAPDKANSNFGGTIRLTVTKVG